MEKSTYDEGSCIDEPSTIQLYMLELGYITEDIIIYFDEQNKIWKWNCKITKI